MIWYQVYYFVYYDSVLCTRCSVCCFFVFFFSFIFFFFFFLVFFCFFFQAEDGIRDLVRSRGLGDVYKRQPQTNRTGTECIQIAEAFFSDTAPKANFCVAG